MKEADYDVFRKRIRDYMVKAIREAKVNTSWVSPNTGYEDAATSFVDAIMADVPDNAFLKDFIPFQQMISSLGMFSSLSQTVLKIASPGVPDLFQGNEIWDFSLVDPDNRRPVDFSMRIRILDELRRVEAEGDRLELARSLITRKDDGAVKLYVTYKSLNYRRDNSELFCNGEYIPLEAVGEKAYHVCAFARRNGDATMLAIAPRFFSKLLQGPEDLPVGGSVWGDAVVMVPFESPGSRYVNIFTGEEMVTVDLNGTAVLNLSAVFSNFPVAFMVRESA
jgi:(1->4)-alpha-D-glucan 1-alpha-D-glucosylmutase